VVENKVKIYDISHNTFHEMLDISNKKIERFAGSVYPLPNNHLAFISGMVVNVFGLIQNKTLAIYSLNSQKFVAEYPLSASFTAGLSVLKDKRLAVYDTNYKNFTLFSFAGEHHRPVVKQENKDNNKDNNKCPIM
jgi:hypothetical protein